MKFTIVNVQLAGEGFCCFSSLITLRRVALSLAAHFIAFNDNTKELPDPARLLYALLACRALIKHFYGSQKAGQ